MEIQNLVHNWLLGGADLKVGLRLFIDYCDPKSVVLRIIMNNPTRHTNVIKLALFNKSGIPFNVPIPAVPKETISNTLPAYTYSVRSEWPFLSSPDCPPELKIIVSDKITAYRDCVQAYADLSKAYSAQQQLDTVQNLVANFISNHEIFKELKHYKDTGKTLGEHPVFEQYKRIRDLRNHTTMDLFKKKKNLEHAIWRNQTNIRIGKRPDLLLQRQSKLKELKMELSEVDRLLI